MTSPEERIRDLVRARGIGDADAEGLLAAVRPTARPSRNPFERWSGEVTVAIGVVVAVLAVATSRLGIRYDGAVDMHVGREAVPIMTALLDQVLAFPITALVFFAVARVLSKSVRLIDVLGFVGAARLPLVVVAVPVALLYPQMPRDPMKPNAAIFVVAAMGLVAVAAHITLLVLGFRTTTAARKGKLAGAFVGALIGSEILTKGVLAIAL